MIIYYTLNVYVENLNLLPHGIFTDFAELGKKGKLCIRRGLEIESYQLAEKFKDKYIDFLKNKYGEKTTIDIIKNEVRNTPILGKKLTEKIENNRIYIEKEISK